MQNIGNKIKGLESRRNFLEDRLLDQTIDKETFKRKHQEINYEIQNLENDSATIENNRGFDLDLVNDVLNLDDNLYETYQNAVFEAKRHYLSIFFERIEVYDKKIQNVVYAPLFQKLLEAEKVTVSSNWLPSSKNFISAFTKITWAFSNMTEMETVKARWGEIKRLQKSYRSSTYLAV